MATTYKILDKVTVGSGGVASIDFTSIPATYTDIVFKCSIRGNQAQVYDTLYFRINGNSSTIYTRRNLVGTGSGVGSGTSTNDAQLVGEANGNSATANTFNNGEIYIPNYAGSNNKSYSIDIVQETNGTLAYVMLNAGLFANTSPISSISFYTVGGTILENSSIYLYGIKNS